MSQNKWTDRFGFCQVCGGLMEDGVCEHCELARGLPWGGGSADEASPGQENAIRALEEALSLIDDHFFDRAA